MPAVKLAFPGLANDQETVPEPPQPEAEGAFEGDIGASRRVSSIDAASTIGVGVTGALGGAVLADAVVTAAGVSVSGEVLADAAALGAVALGGAAIYAAAQPGEAGEAARFVGGSVVNVTAAYAELAALEAEIALLEQQKKAQAKIDETVSEIKATPGRIADEVRATPDKLAMSIKEQLKAAQASAREQVEQTRRKIQPPQ